MTKKLKRNTAQKNKLHWTPYIIGVLFVTLVIVLSQIAYMQDQRSRAQTAANCVVNNANLAIDSEEQKAFDEINAYRQQNGLSQMKLTLATTRAAAWMAQDMATNNYLDHTDKLGRMPMQRLLDCGYGGGTTAENIADVTTPTADALVAQWKASPVHNANMLNPQWTVAGIARVVTPTVTKWVMEFGVIDDNPIPSVLPSESVVPTTAPTTATTVPSTIPSPACLGSCPTMAQPSAVPVATDQPTPTDTPVVSIAPTQEPAATPTDALVLPSVVTPTAGATPPATGNANNGLVQLILLIIIAILDFFKHLFH